MSYLSAKDYYYKFIAPEEAGSNYQQIHQAYLYEGSEDDTAIKIFGHVPNRSNDILIEEYIQDLADGAPQVIQQRLGSVFVAKRRNFVSSAGAVHGNGMYVGDLIFFYV